MTLGLRALRIETESDGVLKGARIGAAADGERLRVMPDMRLVDVEQRGDKLGLLRNEMARVRLDDGLRIAECGEHVALLFEQL